MADDSSQFEMFAKIFIHNCKSKFGWSSLSEDTVMDVGCGKKGVCGKAVKEYFPDVKMIIFIDKDMKKIHKLRLNCDLKSCFETADIEKRDSIERFEGEIDKVFSTHAFHEMENKEEAFRNVYHLLKPGGAAAILFVTKSLIHEWLTEFLKIPLWKALFRARYNKDQYKIENDPIVYYSEMVERIGFRVVECSQEVHVVPYETDEVCKEAVYKMSSDSFRIPPALRQDFKDESLQVLEQLSARDELGRICYSATDLSLLLVKPE